MKQTILLLLTNIIVACGDGSEKWDPNNPPSPPPVNVDVNYNERAKEIFDKIQIHYKSATSGLYKENYPAQSGDGEYSFLWPFDALVSGAALLTESGYDVNYETLVNNFEKYWRDSAAGNNIGGYGSSTNGQKGSGTRFYDDNSIVGISLLEAYHITGNRIYLERAGRIVAFLQSGEDNKLGGGLWWNEDQKDLTGVSDSNKPGCSNGYATQFLLQYHQVCPAAEKANVLAFAKRLYNWLRSNLRDTDNCYWNDINNKGDINRYKWTYNTGVMVQNGICLYRITGEKTYLNEAIASAQGAYDYFVKPRNGVPLAYPDFDPWFNTKLLRAYIDLAPHHAPADNYIRSYINFINYGYEKARTDQGFFYEDWTGASAKRYQQLLMQAAVVESYGAIGRYVLKKLL